MKADELERTLLDQIEKLNDDSIFEDEEKAKMLVSRSEAMAKLTTSYLSIAQTKLAIVRELNNNGGLYEKYLGIEEKKTGKE